MSHHDLPRAPHSRLAPYREGEEWRRRHQRRADVAVEHQETLRRWVDSHGGTVELKNDGYHWHIRIAGELVQWWPESGRVVRGTRWRRPKKAHDVHQVIEILNRWFPREA